MTIDFKTIDRIFAAAEADGRNTLFEHEVYALLRAAGVAAPRFLFVPRGRRIAGRDLAGFKSPELVLKITSPLIQHKTDVGGVVFVKNSPAAVNSALKTMIAAVPGRFVAWLKDKKESKAEGPTPDEVSADLRGVLICEKVAYEKFGFGTELLLGVRHSREFGPVVSLCAGGVEVEYLNARLKEGQAVSMASAHLLARKGILRHLSSLAVFDKLVKPFRGKPAVLAGAALRDVYAAFQALAAHYSPYRPGGGFVIEEAEVNPFVVVKGRLMPLDGLCRFSRAGVEIHDRPATEIRYLLKPASMAVLGVSEKMNMGRIILRNILKMGFPRERLYVIKPGLAEIDGCRCFSSVADLPETVDLFVLTLGAEVCADVVRDLIAHGKARSMIIIAGGMGEKEGTQSIEVRIRDLLAAGRAEGRTTPVINGGNCLGIYSKPGRYDTTFIPDYKLQFPKTPSSGLVHISQSGAFMISRVSKLQRFEPLYAISVGNQIDVRVSDYLHFFRHESEARILAVYVEGFKPVDGYLTALAAREILKTPGRYVVLYKSGRTAEGKMASAGHTASVAGDYGVCRAIFEEAGAIVAETIFEFENFVSALHALGGKTAAGNRVGLISNAGFESVVMSDNLKNGGRLALAEFSKATRERLSAILTPLGIDRLQDIKNPLDTTPMATDEPFSECVRTILADPGVDCAVASPVPMSAAINTLPRGEGHAEDMSAPGSLPSRLIAVIRACPKPVVANIDAGAAYDPMAAMIEEAGIPVFRRADDAVKFLRKFVAVQLRLRAKYGR